MQKKFLSAAIISQQCKPRCESSKGITKIYLPRRYSLSVTSRCVTNIPITVSVSGCYGILTSFLFQQVISEMLHQMPITAQGQNYSMKPSPDVCAACTHITVSQRGEQQEEKRL